MPGDKAMGQDIRALRNARKMTLEEVAKGAGKSLGWVSQVERGLSTPTIDDLHDIARVLDVPLSLFFGIADAPEAERGRIVRASKRRQIGKHENGLVEELLSPDLSDDFEVIHTTISPHSALERSRTRATTEVVYVISGKLEIWISGQQFTVKGGDSFRIHGSDCCWANPYDDSVQAIWVISPPVY